MEGRIGSFGEIAERENKVVRHVRRLLPLAFLSPRVVDAIADGSAPAHFTVTLLTGSLPHSWAEQEKTLGILRAYHARHSPELAGRRQGLLAKDIERRPSNPLLLRHVICEGNGSG